MSRISREVKSSAKTAKYRKNTIMNFNGGNSYVIINPLQKLKMIAASSIFGEASFYRSNVKDGKYGAKIADAYAEKDTMSSDRLFNEYLGKTTTEIFTEAIDEALDYDFGKTLEFAKTLRNEYYMRLNPQIIMVRAAIHPKRKEWTKEHHGEFNKIQNDVMSRADEPMSQLAYYLWINEGRKNNIPSILKRSISNKLSSLSPYQINKYKNAEIGMINAVRLTHANSKPLNELMKNGTIEVSEEQETWEQKRSAGMAWDEIFETTNMGHMALLRNIRNFFMDIEDDMLCRQYLTRLKQGVKSGKQFPYRYYTAYQQIEKLHTINHKGWILDALEECIDLAIEGMPKLSGKTVILSDNSGSAWSAFTSEYGSVEIAEIDNLSAVIAGMCSEESQIVKFGTTCKWFDVSKRNGALSQAKAINLNGCRDVGGATEPGIDEFFQKILNEKIKYDNIIIYSDLQVGHLSLDTHYGWGHRNAQECLHMNVYQALDKYRKEVNSKVNFFSIQTAGYDTILIPEMAYRCAFLTGWTGKEIQFIKEYIHQWDNIESSKS